MSKLLSKFGANIAKYSIALILIGFFAFPFLTAVNWGLDASALLDSRSLIELNNVSSETDIAPFEEPIISITFDDGWQSIYNNGLPILSDYNYPTTQYVLAGSFDDENYFSKKQIEHIYSLGHEIGSHSYNHANLSETNNQATYDSELVESENAISEIIGTDVTHFASPFGAYNDASINEISKTYPTHRNTDGDLSYINEYDVNLKNSFSIHNINAYTVRKSTTLDDLQRLFKYAAENNAWVVLTYHQIETPGTELSEYAITTTDLEKQLTLIQNSGIKVAPLGKVSDEINR